MTYRHLILMINRRSKEVVWFSAFAKRKQANDVFWEMLRNNASRLAIDGDTTLELREMEKPLKYDALISLLED